jgi:hypothetical protein
LEDTTLGITPNQRYGGIYCAIEFVCHLRLWCKYITQTCIGTFVAILIWKNMKKSGLDS